MPLDKDILGLAIYNKAQQWNDTDISEEDIEQARKDFWKEVAGEIINHFQTNGVLRVPALGFVAPSGGGPVTGESITGNIE